MYINNYRVSGEKPWGGGTIIESFNASIKDIESTLKDAKIKYKKFLKSCLSAKDIEKLPVGTIVNAGEKDFTERYKRTKKGWQEVNKKTNRAYGEPITSESLAFYHVSSVE